MCTASYYFLHSLTEEAALWQLLFNTSTVSLLLWVQVAFLLVKVLFINAEGMLRLSYQLPVTNRERAMAFLLYEAVMTAAVVAVGLVSLSVSALIILGPSAMGYLVASIVLPTVLAYLSLSVAYQLLTRMWILIGLGRMSGVLNVLALFAVLAYYSAQMTSMIQGISGAYLNKRADQLWVTSIARAWSTYGPWATGAAVIAASALLSVLVLVFTPNQHVRQSRYLKLPGSVRLRHLLGPYDWCLLRSSQTVAAGVMTLAVFFYLLLGGGSVNPLWSLAALSLGGLYQFTATRPLRDLPGARQSARQVYSRLIKAQVVLLTLFAVPAYVITTSLHPAGLLSSAGVLGSCLGGAVITTCISVVFPAEKDNPFSVFMGLSVVIVVLGLSMIGLGLLNLPPWSVLCCLIGAAIAFVCYAVQGIQAAESRRRNVQGTLGRDVRRRRRVADAGGSDSDAADAGVHIRQ
ncbi:hypothetical protein [Streptomyces sp. SID2119]|uniref:hypothetical protein n=1 Tax=Streptomyces sp. SID2119 TaxID=2690253 RepID=UPI001369E39C|nr:hypothetical protein [Streptomyces sp. SID2119]MYW29339.1 hypothetical protein [Streptomyces sp. SID2119]